MRAKRVHELARNPLTAPTLEVIMRDRRCTFKCAKRRLKRAITRGDQGQHPKPAPARHRKPPHQHRKDANGLAISLVGQNPRRQWLAGLSEFHG